MLHVDGGGGAVTVIVPPVAVVISTPAAAFVEAGFTTLSPAVPGAIPGITVTAAVAITPADIVVEFTPNNTQSTHPALLAQLSVLPAAVAAGPAVMFTALIEAIGYVTLHCTPVGAAPPLGVIVRFTPTVAPGNALPDPKASATCCPHPGLLPAATANRHTIPLRNLYPIVPVSSRMASISTPPVVPERRKDYLVRSTNSQYLYVLPTS
jgi:hypothetical protein